MTLYMQRGHFNAPHLKQIECAFFLDVRYHHLNYFDYILNNCFLFTAKYFTDFCLSHSLLERLRLSTMFKAHDESLTGFHWNKQLFPKIKALSIHPKILHPRFRSSANALWKLLSDCASLEELEICPNVEDICNPNKYERR